MDKYNSYTPEKMQEFYNRGVELRQKYECWDDCCYNEIFRDEDVFRMACAGFYGDEIDFTVKEWYRIGKPSCNEYGQYWNSHNFAEDCPEAGISVITLAWLHSVKSVFFGAHDNKYISARGIYKIKGFIVGYGGDGEPVIYAVDWAEKTRIRSVSGLIKAVKN